MSLSFACPSCKAQIEVPDELAGQTGQCPRCQHVFTVPSPQQPKAAPVGKTRPGETSIPPINPWDQPERPKSKPALGRLDRPRRARALPPQPRGPIWPWFVAIVGGLTVFALLLSSFIVLVAWRKPRTTDLRLLIEAPAARKPQNGVTVGNLMGQQAFLQDGVFQIRTALTNNDPFDQDFPQNRARVFEIELIGNRDYAIEMDGIRFDPRVRLERKNFFPNNFEREVGQVGLRNATIFYRPFRNETFLIIASSVDPATGPFTLTVRDKNRPKPFVP
jgi:predicted Zn finger-like uncharacterized protein